MSRSGEAAPTSELRRPRITGSAGIQNDFRCAAYECPRFGVPRSYPLQSLVDVTHCGSRNKRNCEKLRAWSDTAILFIRTGGVRLASRGYSDLTSWTQGRRWVSGTGPLSRSAKPCSYPAERAVTPIGPAMDNGMVPQGLLLQFCRPDELPVQADQLCPYPTHKRPNSGPQLLALLGRCLTNERAAKKKRTWTLQRFSVSTAGSLLFISIRTQPGADRTPHASRQRRYSVQRPGHAEWFGRFPAEGICTSERHVVPSVDKEATLAEQCSNPSQLASFAWCSIPVDTLRVRGSGVPGRCRGLSASYAGGPFPSTSSSATTSCRGAAVEREILGFKLSPATKLVGFSRSPAYLRNTRTLGHWRLSTSRVRSPLKCVGRLDNR